MVTVKGSGFGLGDGTIVKFGNVIAKAITCSSTTECTMLSPAGGKSGAADVKATVSKKTSKKTPADRFTYD